MSINLKELNEQQIQEDVDLVEENNLIYRGFDSRPWEGCPPLVSELDNLVRKYLPDKEKQELDSILYGVGADGWMNEDELIESGLCLSHCEDMAWEFEQIKKALKEWLYLLIK